MKELFFLLATPVALVSVMSCTEDYAMPENESVTIHSHSRDYYSALKIAEKAVFGSNGQTRSFAPSVKEHYIYTPHGLTRSVGDGENVAFYVINFDDDKGFAVISADDRATPVYAYSDKGCLDLKKAVEESGWDEFIDAACDYYKAELRDTSKFHLTTTDELNKYGDVAFKITQVINGVPCKVTYSSDTLKADALLSTAWDQCSPYNYYYPKKDKGMLENEWRAPAGCVPVALGQIMAYNHYPKSFNGNTYDWNAMLSKSYYYIGEVSSSSINTAHLLYDIACTGNAQMMDSVTSMTYKDAMNVLDKFGYKYSTSSFDKQLVWNSLKKNDPVFTGGERDKG